MYEVVTLCTRFSDAFSDLSLDENKPKPIVTFKEPITTSLINRTCLEKLILVLGCYVLSYEFGDDGESHF